MNHSKFKNSKQLHLEFVRLGSLRHKLKNKMLAMLPEIYKSGIWRKYAGSIIEYAGKYGDIAKTTVIKRLRLEENLKELPYLKAAIEQVGVHKVAMLAKIAKAQTDEVFANKVLNMSKKAIQSLSKELRGKGEDDYNFNGIKALDSCGGDSDNKSKDINKATNDDSEDPSSLETRHCQATPILKRIELDEESSFIFMKLKMKLSKNLTDKDFIKKLLHERDKQEFEEKEVALQQNVTGEANKHKVMSNSKISSISRAKNISGETLKDNFNEKTRATSSAKNITGETAARDLSNNIIGKVRLSKLSNSKQKAKCVSPSNTTLKHASRYIPTHKKRQTIAQTKGKCAYPNCNSPYQIIHHTKRYSESKNHDHLAALCKIHHEFAHNNLIENEVEHPKQWRMQAISLPGRKTGLADILYRKYRQMALR